MNKMTDKIAATLDAKLEVMRYLKSVNEKFHYEFVKTFLSDPLTFIGFEKDFVNALNVIAGIMVCRDYINDLIIVRYKSIDQPFESYEDAFRFCVGLLIVRDNATV